MKIVICGSMDFKAEMGILKKRLETVGYEITIPQGARKEPFVPRKDVQPESEKQDEFHCYYKEIKSANAILVANEEKKNIAGYIGANTLIEMSFAYVCSKMILLLHESPTEGLPYLDEIDRMKPFDVISRDLDEVEFRRDAEDSLSKSKWPGVREYKRQLLKQYTFHDISKIRDALLDKATR